MWNLTNGTNKPIYKTEIGSQMYKQTYDYEVGKGDGVKG